MDVGVLWTLRSCEGGCGHGQELGTVQRCPLRLALVQLQAYNTGADLIQLRLYFRQLVQVNGVALRDATGRDP